MLAKEGGKIKTLLFTDTDLTTLKNILTIIKICTNMLDIIFQEGYKTDVKHSENSKFSNQHSSPTFGPRSAAPFT